MRALQASRAGGPDVLQLVDLPTPNPGRGQVRVRVRAASLNPVDVKIRSGALPAPGGFPRTLGADFAGVVTATGPGVKDFRVGQRIYGALPPLGGEYGAFAEEIVVSERGPQDLPDRLSFAEGAAIPVAGLTAMSVFRAIGGAGGKRVLVVGATGGVGHFATQIARARYAKSVVAACRAELADFARELGAERVIAYDRGELEREPERAYDLVFDAWGGLGAEAASRLLAPAGVYATTRSGGGGRLGRLKRVVSRLRGGPRTLACSLRPNDADFEEIEAIWRVGKLRPRVGAVFPVERHAEAFARLEAGGVPGKVVLTFD